jgi:uncharacterized protein
MRRSSVWLWFILLYLVFPMASHADQLEDGTAAMKNGDYKSAYQLLYPLAMEGNATAQDCIGTMLSEGLGVGKDEIQAVSWYQKSADQGYAQAQYALGAMYVNGQGVEKDLKKGLSYIVKAAQQGSVVAQQNAYALYYQEAKEGNAGAYHNVAYACLKGWAGEVNPSDCTKLLETAAQNGFTKSASALAKIYSEGMYGIEPDAEKAAYWKDYAENPPETPATKNDAPSGEHKEKRADIK